MKQLLIVFALTLISTCGCSSSNSHIANVLELDAAATRNATSINEVATTMRSIDLSRCPSDFQAAYVTHIQAWEQFALLEADAMQYDKNYNSGPAMLESFLRGMMGDLFGKASESVADQRLLQQRYIQITQQVQSTFHDVERIAITHGVSLPKKDAVR